MKPFLLPPKKESQIIATKPVSNIFGSLVRDWDKQKLFSQVVKEFYPISIGADAPLPEVTRIWMMAQLNHEPIDTLTLTKLWPNMSDQTVADSVVVPTIVDQASPEISFAEDEPEIIGALFLQNQLSP